MTPAFQKTTGIRHDSLPENDRIYFWQLWHHSWDDREIAIFRQSCNLEGRRVLEVGCGDGRVAFGLAETCKDLLAVDIDQELLDVAAARLAKADIPNLTFQRMDGLRLELPDESIDVALYPWVMHMVDDQTMLMREAWRVLKTGGMAAIIGPHSYVDYNEIIAPFVHSIGEIDHKSLYEQPIRTFFGDQVRIMDKELFRYYFKTTDIAHQAFLYAFGFTTRPNYTPDRVSC